MLKYFLPLMLAATSFVCADNFYMGASAGVSSLDAKMKHQLSDNSRNEEHHLGALGFVGGGLIGYNFDLNCSYDCGVEVFANGFTTEAKARHLTSTAVTSTRRLKITEGYNLGVRILPGYRFLEWAEGHLVLGYTYTDFRLRDNGVYGNVSKNFHANGYQVGLGTTIDIYCNIALRLDVVYSGYPQNHHATSSSIDGVATQYKVKASSVDSTVALLYSF